MGRTKTNLITEEKSCNNETPKGKKPNDVLFGADSQNIAFKELSEDECMKIHAWSIPDGETISVFEVDRSNGLPCEDSGTGAEYPYSPCCGDTGMVFNKAGTYYVNGGGQFKFVFSGATGTASVKFKVIERSQNTFEKECGCC
jgi:hypothetical protein